MLKGDARVENRRPPTHIYEEVRYKDRGRRRRVRALIDTGASANFISRRILGRRTHKLKKHEKPLVVSLLDGRQENITHYADLTVTIQGRVTKLRYEVVPNLEDPMVLGLPWLRANQVTINWNDKTIQIPDPV